MLNTFSEAVVYELLRKENLAETIDTVHEWRRACPNDREEAALKFACQLSTDLEEMYCAGKDFVPQMMRLALRHVNWRRVVEYLLDRFAPPPEKQLVIFHAIRIPSMN